MSTRNTDGYRNTLSRDGSFSPRLSQMTTRRLMRYCESQNFNKTKFVEDCVNERLDVLERETLNSMPKEMLVELLMSKKELK